MLEDYKTWLATAAIGLTIYAYVPYVRGLLAGTTKPHMFTWIIWSLVTFIAVSIQVTEGAKAGAWPTIVAAILCFWITLMSIKHGTKDIRRSDWFFFIASLSAIPLWLWADDPTSAAILVTALEIVAAIPTLRKSWHAPHEEVASTYGINTLRYVLSIFAVASFSIPTLAYPIGMVFMNGLIFAVLVCRKTVSK